MMRKYIFILLFFPVCLSAQTDPVLLKINGQEITRSQFEYTYRNDELSRNGLSPVEYLPLFINDQLKIDEAKSLGMDISTTMEPEIEKYRRKLNREYFSYDESGEQEYPDILPGDNILIEGYQIYKYLPQNTPAQKVNRINQQMDSLYNAINRNSSINFMELVEKYSDDKKLFTLTRLEVPEEFEKEVFHLRAGEISKPFFTPQGIHIVKVIQKYQNITSKEAESINKGEQRRNKGVRTPRQATDKIKQKYQYNPNNSAVNELIKNGKTNDVLFTIDHEVYTMTDFERFARDNPRGIKSQVDEFITKSLYDYDRNHAEQNHPDIELQMQFYKDRLLLNEINNRTLGENIVRDKNALKNYFNHHKKEYYWELPRYRGIVIHTANKSTEKRIKKELKKIKETEWIGFINRNYNSSLQPGVISEYGTFAVGQNDYIDKIVFKVGSYTPIPSHPFTIVMGKKIKGPESFEEIPDIVAADYRNELETRWINRLRNKSKVEINQEVLKTVNIQ